MVYELPSGSDSHGSDTQSDVTRIKLSEGATSDHVVIQDAQFLLSAKFTKAGSDLVLTGHDGQKVVLEGYFSLLKHPALMAPGGGGLSAEVVERLAGSETPGQYAQVGAPAGAAVIGRVERVGGSATVQHANGVVQELHVGDTVLQGDVVETRDGSQLGMSFIDGTAFNLGTNARMVLNELVYDSSSSSNSAVFSIVKGTISFVAGQAAKTGDMRVVTPISTMGIRGTAANIVSTTDAFQNVISVTYSLMADPDGHIGAFNILDTTTNTIIGAVSTTDSAVIITPVANLIPLAQIIQKTPEIIQQELAIAQLLFPIFLSHPINFANAQQPDLQPRAAGSNTNSEAFSNAQGQGDPATKVISETVIGVIKTAGQPDITISTQQHDVVVHVNQPPLINIDSGPHLVEAGANGPGVATSIEQVIKSDLDPGDTALYNTNALADDHWDDLGNGIFAKLGSYGAATLDTVGVAAATFLASGWTDVGSGIFQKVVTLHTSTGGLVTETVQASTGANTLTFALDNAKVDPLHTGDTVTENFTIPVIDTAGAKNSASTTFVIEGANDAPVAHADGPYAINQGGTLAVTTANGVLSNDTDAESDHLTAVLVNGPAHALPGSFALNADGSFSYHSAGNFSGQDSFTYHAFDGQAASSDITVLIDVAPVSLAAHDDSYTVTLGQTLHVDAPGVLSNDTGPDPLVALLQSGTLDGFLSFNADGSFDFEPYFKGTTTFTYEAANGAATSAAATVTINTTANTAPGAGDTIDLSGNTSDNFVFADATTKNIIGGSGNDALIGNNNGNILNGGGGNDSLQGGSGNDILISGPGFDGMSGGAGDDVFVFRPGFGHDNILDFNVGDALHHDTLDLRGLGFTSVADVLDQLSAATPNVTIHSGADEVLLLHVTKDMLAANTAGILV
jgi:VCBS repeat-containing protein